MTREDGPRFAAAMTTAALVVDVVMEKARIKVFFDALIDLPIEAVEFGLAKVIREWDSNRFPPPAVIRRFAVMWRKPVPAGDLARRALPESTMSHEAACRRMQEILDGLAERGAAYAVEDLVGSA